MTPAEIRALAERVADGRHQGDPSTYYSAMLILARALLAYLPVVEAAESWAKYGRDDGDDENDLLREVRKLRALRAGGES